MAGYEGRVISLISNMVNVQTKGGGYCVPLIVDSDGTLKADLSKIPAMGSDPSSRTEKT